MSISEEAQSIINFEEDVEWFAAMGGYDDIDGDEPDAPDPEADARAAAGAATYRERKVAFCLDAEEAVRGRCER